MRISYLFCLVVALSSCQKNGSSPSDTNPSENSLAVDPVEELSKNEQPLPLSNEQIQEAIDAEMTSIGSCYEQNPMESAQSAESRVETEFLITPTGEPVDIKSWGLSDAINDCVADAISKVRFPTFVGEDPMGVQYPFEFAPEADQGTTQP